MYTILLVQVSFHPDPARGEDGAAWYVILSPCPDNPCTHVCKIHPRMVHHYERQPFRLGAFGHRPGATPQQIADDEANVWGWDGNKEAPTLTPSFLGPEQDKKGRTIRPYRLHSFLTAGKLVLCGDSTVTLDPNPVSCWDS